MVRPWRYFIDQSLVLALALKAKSLVLALALALRVKSLLTSLVYTAVKKEKRRAQRRIVRISELVRKAD